MASSRVARACAGSRAALNAGREEVVFVGGNRVAEHGGDRGVIFGGKIRLHVVIMRHQGAMPTRRDRDMLRHAEIALYHPPALAN